MNLEEKTEKRQKPKTKVINTRKSMVRAVYDGKCPNCMKPPKKPEVDHFSSRAWGGIHDTRLICGDCNRALYLGKLVRAEILPRFATYQGHLKEFIGGEQLTFLCGTKEKPYVNE